MTTVRRKPSRRLLIGLWGAVVTIIAVVMLPLPSCAIGLSTEHPSSALPNWMSLSEVAQILSVDEAVESRRRNIRVAAAQDTSSSSDRAQYFMGHLRRDVSLHDVRRFVDHDDVHWIPSLADSEAPQKRKQRSVLVYMDHDHSDNWGQTIFLAPPVPTTALPLTAPHSVHLSRHLWPRNATLLAATRRGVPQSHDQKAMEVVLLVHVANLHALRVQQSINSSAGADVTSALADLIVKHVQPLSHAFRPSSADSASPCDVQRHAGVNRRPRGPIRLRLLTRRPCRMCDSSDKQQHHEDRDAWEWVAHACAPWLASMASLPFVRWIEPARRLSLENYRATISMQNPQQLGGLVHTAWESGITGAGQIVSVADSGLDYDSCFFHDASSPVTFWPTLNPSHRKVVSYQECVADDGTTDHGDAFAAHGTHVAGSIAGNSLGGQAEYNGMAIDAKLFFQDMKCQGQSVLYVPADMSDVFEPAMDLGSRISSNSWGAQGGSVQEYGGLDRLADKFLYENQQMLGVFAAGNDAMAGILSPAACKNVLSVGAHMNSLSAGDRERIASFSARGPTYDGRIKPDLTAPGDDVLSAMSDGIENSFQCSVTKKSGTSMATPLVAGSAALLRQYLAEGRMESVTGAKNLTAGITDPSAALMKALLIQSATPMLDPSVGTPPNAVQGFGRLELPLLLRTPETQSEAVFRWFQDGLVIRHGEIKSWCFAATASAPAVARFDTIQVTLVWIDAASAAEGSHRSLVNDLDLSLVDSEGQVYRGNGPKGSTTGAFDRDNTVERVTVPFSSVATNGRSFRVVVSGHDVPDDGPYGGQPFAVVLWAPIAVELHHHGICTSVEAKCPNDCSGGGTCDSATGACLCDVSRQQLDCSECNATHVCHGNGLCTLVGAGAGVSVGCTCDASGLRHLDTVTDPHCGVCQRGWFGPHCDNDCVCSRHGSCDATGVCLCDRPERNLEGSCFSGQHCESCCVDFSGSVCNEPSYWCANHGVRLINGSSPMVPLMGRVQINGGTQYDNSMFCTWIWTAPGPGWTVQLHFDVFDVEDRFDYVRVYDGGRPGDRGATEIGRFSGTSLQGKNVTSSNSFLELTFFADYTGNGRGFEASYTFLPPNPATTTSMPTTTIPQLTTAPATVQSTASPATASPVTTSVPATAAPPASPSCDLASDCLNHAYGCDAATHTCKCRSLFTGALCGELCPATYDAEYGNMAPCNSAGRCVATATSSSTSHAPKQGRCVECADGFLGSVCHINTVTHQVAYDVPLDTSSGVLPLIRNNSESEAGWGRVVLPAVDRRAEVRQRRGVLLSVDEDLGMWSETEHTLTFPLEDNRNRLEGLVPLGRLNVGPQHVLSLQLRLPPYLPPSVVVSEARRSVTRLRWYVVLPPLQDPVQCRVSADDRVPSVLLLPELVAWPNHSSVGLGEAAYVASSWDGVDSIAPSSGTTCETVVDAHSGGCISTRMLRMSTLDARDRGSGDASNEEGSDGLKGSASAGWWWVSFTVGIRIVPVTNNVRKPNLTAVAAAIPPFVDDWFLRVSVEHDDNGESSGLPDNEALSIALTEQLRINGSQLTSSVWYSGRACGGSTSVQEQYRHDRHSGVLQPTVVATPRQEVVEVVVITNVTTTGYAWADTVHVVAVIAAGCGVGCIAAAGLLVRFLRRHKGFSALPPTSRRTAGDGGADGAQHEVDPAQAASADSASDDEAREMVPIAGRKGDGKREGRQGIQNVQYDEDSADSAADDGDEFPHFKFGTDASVSVRF